MVDQLRAMYYGEMSFTCEQATWGHMTPHEKELSTGGGSAGGERLGVKGRFVGNLWGLG